MHTVYIVFFSRKPQEDYFLVILSYTLSYIAIVLKMARKDQPKQKKKYLIVREVKVTVTIILGVAIVSQQQYLNCRLYTFD